MQICQETDDFLDILVVYVSETMLREPQGHVSHYTSVCDVCPMHKYIRRIALYTPNVSQSTFLLALEYINRLSIVDNLVEVTKHTINRLLCSACWVALYTEHKTLPSSAHWSKVCGVTVEEIGRNTSYMLQRLQYSMIVNTTFVYSRLLLKYQVFALELKFDNLLHAHKTAKLNLAAISDSTCEHNEQHNLKSVKLHEPTVESSKRQV